MRKNLIRKIFLVIGDICIVIFSIYISFIIRFQKNITLSDLNPLTLSISVFIFISFLYISGTYDLEEKKYLRSKKNLVLVAASCLFASVTNAVIFYAIPSIRYGRGLFGIQFVSITLLVIVCRLITSFVFKVVSREKKIVVIAPLEDHGNIRKMMKDLSDFKVLNYIDFHEVDRIEKDAIRKQGIETIVFSGTINVPDNVQEKILEMKVSGIEVVEIIAFIEEVLEKIPVAFLKKDWILLVDGFSFFHTKINQRIKRMLDLLFSVIGFLISFPLWIVLPILIRMDSEGAIIYKQLRVGKNHKPFWLLKFRTMFKEAENGKAKWAMESDPRITRVGKILRKLRVDEVPQLINVLKGEMSLIGPRPERPDFVSYLEEKIPFYSLRHTVSPGLTGWAQVKYPYGASVEDAIEKLQYDLYYVKNMDIFLDLLIVIKTIRVVLTGRGAR